MAKKKKKADEKPKKKKAARPADDDDDFEEEEYAPDTATKPKLDIYVGLSAVTLLILIAAAVFFYLDVDAGKGKSAPLVNLTVGGAAGRPAPGPVQPGN